MFYETLEPIYLSNNNVFSFEKSNNYFLEKGVFIKIVDRVSNLFSTTIWGEIIVPGYHDIKQNLGRVDISTIMECNDKLKEVTYNYIIRNYQQIRVFNCECRTEDKQTSTTFDFIPCGIHKALGLSYLRKKRDCDTFNSFTREELINYFILTKQEKGSSGSKRYPLDLFKLPLNVLIEEATKWYL